MWYPNSYPLNAVIIDSNRMIPKIKVSTQNKIDNNDG
jgi:hypothetical protein